MALPAGKEGFRPGSTLLAEPPVQGGEPQRTNLPTPNLTRSMEGRSYGWLAPRGDIVTGQELSQDYRELSPLVRETLSDPHIGPLVEALYEHSGWKGDHVVDLARMTEGTTRRVRALGYPLLPDRTIVRAFLTHDVGVIDNPETKHDPFMVNSDRVFNDDERRRFNIHAPWGAIVVAEQVPDFKEEAVLIRDHHDYEMLKRLRPDDIYSSTPLFTQLLFNAMDSRHGQADGKRPYPKWTNPNDPTEERPRVFDDEKIRWVLGMQAPHLPHDVLDIVMDEGAKVISTPVPEHRVKIPA